MDVSALNPSRWRLILTLLSLDSVVPLYDAMGLRFPDKGKFVLTLRNLLNANHETYEGKRPPDDSFVSLAERVLHEIELLFGKQIAINFYNWSTTVFFWVHEDQPQWSAWNIILLYFDGLEQDKILAPEKQDLIEQFRAENKISDVKQQVERLELAPPSEWDREISAIYNYNYDDSEEGVINPFSIVLSTTKMSRYQLAWQNLLTSLDQDEKTRLWHFGQGILEQEGIEMPETLCHPDKLHRRI